MFKKFNFKVLILPIFVLVCALTFMFDAKNTYSRYTYHAEYTDIVVTVPATETCNGELSCVMLINSTGESTVSTAKTVIEAKGTPTFSSTSTTDEGLYAAEDDYGTSYYYRGAVEDNYVYFAGYYWRIIRRNGDGSVRLIYDGTSAHSNGESSTDRYTTTKAFNSSYNSNTYVGYMYDNSNIYADGGISSSTSTKTLQSYYYYYASGYTFDESTGYYTLTNPTQEVWNSNLAGYYTCRSTSTTCTSMYYISSYYSIYQGKYYTYSRSSSTDDDGNTVYSESHGTSTTTGTFATRYYYGTGYTFNSSTGYVLTGYAYNIYDGTGTASDLTGYYTCGSTSYTGCSALYYIDSASSATVANVYTYTKTGTSYEETHVNTTSSTIKTYLDGWYEDYLASYADYLSDEIFCNDRSVYSGTGTGTTVSYYYGYNRLYSNKKPVLTCTNQNDEFTVNEATLEDGTTVGNGDLTYPIGLITADEVAMAGGVYNTSNSSYYLYIGNYFWTMTPSGFIGSLAFEWLVGTTGFLDYYNFVDYSSGARPVVNLSSEVLVESGTGTSSDPYIVTLPSE